MLKHLVETAHIAGIMAAELGLDPTLIKRGAFLHDIGKALTHEVEGSHALIGADLARKYGENDDVVHAIEAHHNEVPPQTIEAVLTQAADACSGGRPGARRESLEAYVKRLERIEEIAAGKPRRREGLRHAGRPGDPGDGPARTTSTTSARAGAGPRGGQADRGGADLPGPDPGHRRPRVPGHRDRPLTGRARPTPRRRGPAAQITASPARAARLTRPEQEPADAAASHLALDMAAVTVASGRAAVCRLRAIRRCNQYASADSALHMPM